MQNAFTSEARRARRTAEEYKTFSAVLRVLRASAVNESGFRPWEHSHSPFGLRYEALRRLVAALRYLRANGWALFA